jgi:hypothetical protein
MVTINSRWTIERDNDQWTLFENIPGKNRETGEPIITARRRYFPSLQSAVLRVSELSPEDALDYCDLLLKLDELINAVKGIKL